MSYCNGTSNQWVLCDQKGHPETIVKPDPCYCPTSTAERSMTLSQYSTINETAWLPSGTGSSVQFFAGFFPTVPSTTASPTATAASNPVTTAAGALTPTRSSSSPQTPAAISNSNLTTGDTIGIAVSASIGGVAILAGLFQLFLHRRRARKAQLAAQRARHPSRPSISMPTTAAAAAPWEETPTVSALRTGVPTSATCSSSSTTSQPPQLGSPNPSAFCGLGSNNINKAARPWSIVSEMDGEGGSSAAGKGFTMAGMPPTSPARMESIMEHGYCYGERRAGRSELPVHELTELPA
ncbi:hypothetical protein OPQ81_005048 [Rhizoctonia solani]|nr:hypothetical protein OPQ81_005048 [Rhizoctonia solani]